MAFYARSGSGGPYTNLNLLFKGLTSSPAADTKYVYAGDDLSALFEPSTGPSDRIGFATHYIVNGVDLQNLFRDINYASITKYLLSVWSGSGSGLKNSGSYAPITASVLQHYTFDSWTGDTVVSPSSAQTTVLMDSNKVVSASYNINQYTLIVNDGTGDGTQNYGYVYTITSTPPANKHFTIWSSGQSPSFVNGTSNTDDPADVTISENTTISANFAWDQYVLTITNGNGDGTFDYNATMPIEADAAPAYQVFSTWVMDPPASLTFDNATAASTNAYFAAAGNATAEATYAWADYTLTMQKDDGITSTSPAVGAHTKQYPDFPITVTAVVEWDYDFAHWELDSSNVGGSAAGYNITSVGSHTMKAVSSLKNVAFTASSAGNGSPTADYPQYPSSVPIHTTVTITPNPDAGYYFDYMSANNSGVVSGLTCQLEGVGLTTITAYYLAATLNVTAMEYFDGSWQSGNPTFTDGVGPYAIRGAATCTAGFSMEYRWYQGVTVMRDWTSYTDSASTQYVWNPVSSGDAGTWYFSIRLVENNSFTNAGSIVVTVV